jgi:hypothetical protein
MPRKNASKNNHQNLSKTPWYKQVWFVISATAVVVSTILLNGPIMLQNARILPKEVIETKKQFKSWIKEDKEWTGHWSSFPEGIVNMGDLNLSDVDMQITIWSSEGYIDGTIATKKICKSIPVFNYILLRGEVNGDTARVIAWDIIQGHKTDFAELTLQRDEEVLTVTPVSGQMTWFPESARLGRTPRKAGAEPEPDQSFCTEERKEFFKELNSTKLKQG